MLVEGYRGPQISCQNMKLDALCFHGLGVSWGLEG